MDLREEYEKETGKESYFTITNYNEKGVVLSTIEEMNSPEYVEWLEERCNGLKRANDLFTGKISFVKEEFNRR